jgi:catechol 2,3-dioxygenase-like lactoylglutathione lyase family enzyme
MLRTSLLLLAALLPAQSPRAAPVVAGVATPVSELARSRDFYRDALGFTEVGGASGAESLPAPFAFPRSEAAGRILLAAGQERIELWQPREAGDPYPRDLRSQDLGFQHLALVVRDLDAAVARVRAHGAAQISASPQRIPATNPAAGGVGAFYFRDPDGHPLELIHFPAGRGDPRWQEPASCILLGIDHTAIAVQDTDRSLRFWRDDLGLAVLGGSFNSGREQELLSGVGGAQVRITGLRGRGGPGVEFLHYLWPRDGRSSRTPGPHDLLNREVVVLVEAEEGLPPPGRVQRDPDGHAVRLVAAPRESRP